MLYYLHGNIDVITLSNKIYNFQDKVKYNNLIRRQDILLQKETLHKLLFIWHSLLYCCHLLCEKKRISYIFMIIAFVNTMTKQKSLLKGHKLFYMSNLDALFSQMIQTCLGKKLQN